MVVDDGCLRWGMVRGINSIRFVSLLGYGKRNLFY